MGIDKYYRKAVFPAAILGLMECNGILKLGGVFQKTYAASVTQNYLLGTRRITWDGRVFKYAKAVGTLECDYSCRFDKGVLFPYVALGASQNIGDSQVTLVVTPGTTLAEDELKGGYISIFKAGLGDSINRGIIGNTVLTSIGTSITIYLDEPLERAVVITTDHAEVLPNPYIAVKNTHVGGDGYGSIAGLPNTPATDGQYCWIQTWGIRWMSPQHAGIGGATNERSAYFDPAGGGVDEHNYSTFAYPNRQLAGFVVDKTTAGVDGSPFIMLQISI